MSKAQEYREHVEGMSHGQLLDVYAALLAARDSHDERRQIERAEILKRMTHYREATR